MSKRIIEALSQAGWDFYNKISDADPYSPFIEFLRKIDKDKNFGENLINGDHITVLQDLVKDGTLNLSEEWLLNPRLYSGDYTKVQPFKYLLYVLDVMNESGKFRRYYSDLPKEEAQRLKEDVAKIPDYKTLQDLIQQADAKQKSLIKKTGKLTPEQVWETAKDNYSDKFSEGNDKPVEAALVIGSILKRISADDLKAVIAKLPLGDKINGIIDTLVDIYNVLEKAATTAKEINEDVYRSIVNTYDDKPQFEKEPFNKIINAMAKTPSGNNKKLITNIIDILDTLTKSTSKEDVNPSNPDDVAPKQNAQANTPPKGKFGRAFK